MKKIDKLAMRMGYMEMAGINLTIAQEDFHLETEGACLHEMDKENGENKAI